MSLFHLIKLLELVDMNTQAIRVSLSSEGKTAVTAEKRIWIKPIRTYLPLKNIMYFESTGGNERGYNVN